MLVLLMLYRRCGPHSLQRVDEPFTRTAAVSGGKAGVLHGAVAVEGGACPCVAIADGAEGYRIGFDFVEEAFAFGNGCCVVGCCRGGDTACGEQVAEEFAFGFFCDFFGISSGAYARGRSSAWCGVVSRWCVDLCAPSRLGVQSASRRKRQIHSRCVGAEELLVAQQGAFRVEHHSAASACERCGGLHVAVVGSFLSRNRVACGAVVVVFHCFFFWCVCGCFDVLMGEIGIRVKKWNKRGKGSRHLLRSGIGTKRKSPKKKRVKFDNVPHLHDAGT